jgi:hypothetical protein
MKMASNSKVLRTISEPSIPLMVGLGAMILNRRH